MSYGQQQRFPGLYGLCFQQLSSARPTLIKPCRRCEVRLWKWVEQLSGFPVRGWRLEGGGRWGLGCARWHPILTLYSNESICNPCPCQTALAVGHDLWCSGEICVWRRNLPLWFLGHCPCLNYFLVWFNITFEVSKRIFDTWGNSLESTNPVVLHGWCIVVSWR